MNRLINVTTFIIGILAVVILAVFLWWLGRYANYSLSYKSMVEETVREMVKPEALKPVGIHRIVTVTAYSRRSGKVTASGQRVRPGIIALSRDLERDLGATFGDLIHLSGIGAFEFQDRMSHYWTERVDVYQECYHEAKRFGVKTAIIGG
jgi:3D (Asp-Asp-Asp) domain-containing protein